MGIVNVQVGSWDQHIGKLKKKYIEIFTSDAVVFIGGIVKKRTISIYLQ